MVNSNLGPQGVGAVVSNTDTADAIAEAAAAGDAAFGAAGGIEAFTELDLSDTGLAPNVEATYALTGTGVLGPCPGNGVVNAGGVASIPNAASFNDLTVVTPSVGPNCGTLKATLYLNWVDTAGTGAQLYAVLDPTGMNGITVDLSNGGWVGGSYYDGSTTVMVGEAINPLGGSFTVYPESDGETCVNDTHAIEAKITKAGGPIDVSVANVGFNLTAQASYYIE
ncbi:MAG: hypothetical protein IAG10_03270 [Planctomycetaceae bacterium]|nr:hypothetical protein [Planctomycetaceae bacterium]